MSYAHSRFLNSPEYSTIQDNANLQTQINSLNYRYLKTIESISDFPGAVANVITLVPDTTYLITTSIDLGNSVLDCSGGKVAIIGNSSEISLVSSNAITAMITSDDTLVLRWISLTSTAGSVFDLDAAAPASGNTDPAIDWFGVNIVDSAAMGIIANYNNFIGFSLALLNSSELQFDGTFGTIAFDTSIFTTPLGASITISPTCIITRRLRFQFCAFVAAGVNFAISVDAGATINAEQYILFRNNFSGGATAYLEGVQSTDDKANFKTNFGITDSHTIAHYYMTDNKTVTDCVDSKHVKIAGTTTSGTLHQRFTQTVSNRAVYNGAETAIFRVSITISLTGSNNIDYSLRIGVDGVTLVDSTSLFSSTGTGDASNIASQSIVELDPGEYIEVYISNLTNDSDPTSISLNVIATKIES